MVHRRAGLTFVVAMLVMALPGAVLAGALSKPFDVLLLSLAPAPGLMPALSRCAGCLTRPGMKRCTVGSFRKELR